MASVWAARTDEELHRLYRKLAVGGRFPFDVIIERELQSRLVFALARFSDASDRAAKRLERLTWALVLLTVVIAVLTVALVLGDG